MKNLDPKIAAPVAVVVILLAFFFIMRSAGVVGRSSYPEPYVTGPNGNAISTASGAASATAP